jgi:hypothetical protein
VAAPEQTLEALVRDELRGPVSELVRQVVVELVREELNGHAPQAGADAGHPSANDRSVVAAEMAAGGARLPPQATNRSAAASDPSPASTDLTTKRCSSCGEVKPARAFAVGRRQCRSSRNRQEVERQRRRREAAVDDAEEVPRPTGVVDAESD